MTSPLEALAFAIGIKPALRLSLSPADAAREAGRWRARGAVVLEGGPMIYVARDLARADALRAAEAAVLPDGSRRAPDADVRAAHREVGRLLGYPPCCVEGFLGRLERGVEVRPDGSKAAERVVAAEVAWRRASCHYARLNFLLPRRRALVPFEPCAFDCDAALKYADALWLALQARDPADAAALEGALIDEITLGLDGPLPRGAAPERIVLRLTWDGF